VSRRTIIVLISPIAGAGFSPVGRQRIRSRITGRPGNGSSTTSHGSARRFDTQARPFLPLMFTAFGAAHAFAARTPKTQARIDRLDVS
jgi:hypothetical protein